jgi:acetate kinase
MRQLEAAAQNGHNEAQLALDVYCYQLAKHIAAMSSALSEVHALVFTGGIGENSSHVRQAVVAHLKNLGLRLDKQKNQQPKAHQGRIHDTDSRCPILVIATQEETLIAQETRRCVENQA